MTMLPMPDGERLLADLETLAQYTEPDTPGWTRRFPSVAYQTARAWLRDSMHAAGLSTHIDAGGNLIGVLPGSADLPPIIVGSHTDTVLGGGRYDGNLGVLAALEVARCLHEQGVRLRHPLHVVDFLGEEANGYGISCVGSRAMCGTFDPAWLTRRVHDTPLADAIAAMGGTPADLPTTPPAVACALELHIEQGPVLAQRGATLGAVSGIVGIKRGTLRLQGQADHAGTTPMDGRRDALAAAAILIHALETVCRAAGDAVGTVGMLTVSPNQSNVVPDDVRLTAEIRSLARERIAALWDDVMQVAHRACAERYVTLIVEAVTETPPAVAPPWLVETLFACCQALDPHALIVPSGAGHDSSQLARVAPTAMLFVPSVGGRSHCPQEATAPDAIVRGVTALAHAVVTLDTYIATNMVRSDV